jgi:membrane fusion protein, multidrug efflux system
MRFWIAASGLFALLILCASCQSDTSAKSSGDNGKKVRTVRVARAEEGKLARTIGVSGTLAAEEEVVLSLKVTGRVKDIYVDLGSRVRKGQPLVKLEPADFELRVQQAEAALEQARARLSLQAEDKNSDPQVNPKDTGVVRQAEAQLEQARLTQDRMTSLWNNMMMRLLHFAWQRLAIKMQSMK